MDFKMETIKFTLGTSVSTIIALLGSNYKLVIFLMIVMAVDTVLGHLRAVHNHNWTSYNARWGVIGKLVELTLVMLMYFCEWCFGIDWLVNIIATYFLICEAASIVENIVQGHLNENVPESVSNIFMELKQNGVSFVIKKVQKIFGDEKYNENK